MTPRLPFCWQLWETELPVGPAKAFTVRARTKTGEVQPETADWNFKGYCYNGYHTRAL